MMKILFRTSGGRANKKELGLGHIYRCINLASQLKGSHELHFLIEDYGGVKKILNNYELQNVSLLKKNICMHLDIKQTIQYIKRKKIDIVIIDKYIWILYLNWLINICKKVKSNDKLSVQATIIVNDIRLFVIDE